MAPNLTIDGHRMFFHSTRSGGCGGMDLYLTTRRDAGDDFGWEPPVNLGCVINGPFNDAGPTYTEEDGTAAATIYFNSDRPGGPGGLDIYKSVLGPDGTWGAATLVPELSGPLRDTRTAIARDGLELFLSSESSGRQGGIGSQDVWVSTRSTPLDPWSTPLNLGSSVNTAAFDGGPAISFDGTALYFFSNRTGGSGGNDLYVATRSRIRGAGREEAAE